jgi:hypothetical protein
VSNERKASDIILELENKIDILLGLCRTQDLNIKILSNKLNSVMELLNKKENKITIETVNTSTSTPVIPISAESTLPMESFPKGFRRNSRPETYEGDNSYLPNVEEVKFPVQLPNKPAEVVIPNHIAKPTSKPVSIPPEIEKQVVRQAIPVTQRVIDKNAKSIFLADVEIVDDKNSTVKTRTKGNGKWEAILSPGNYKVIIRKRESLTKEKLESSQDIVVDGSVSPLELPILTMK